MSFMSATSDLNTSDGSQGWVPAESPMVFEDNADASSDDGWRRIRVFGPGGAVDVSLPTVRPVADLVDELLTSLLPGAPLNAPDRLWHLHRVGRYPLPPGATLAAAGVRDGEVLHLTEGSVPTPVHQVDDALDVLGAGASQTGLWTFLTAGAVAATAAVLLGAGASLLALLVAPRGPAVPLLVAAGLLLAAVNLREGKNSPVDLGSDVAALASLPAWVAAGVAASAALADRAFHLDAGLGGLGLTVGAIAAAVCAPRRAGWWAFAWSAGAAVTAGGVLVAADLLTVTHAAAVLGTVVLVLVGMLPWLVSRSPLWASASVEPSTEASLLSRARGTRELVTAVSAAGACAVAACASVLAVSDSGLARALAGVLALVLGLRARRSRFVHEAVPRLAAAAVPLTALAGVLALRGEPWLQLALLATAVGLCVASVSVVRLSRGATLDEGAGIARLDRPRVRRSLDVLEMVAAITVVPLLVGVLGIYAAAADAGSRL